MNKKDITTLIVAGSISAVMAFVISGVIFSPKKYSAEVPTVEAINSSFPDVKNDTKYSNFLNPDKLDLTVPVEIGQNQ